MPRRGSIKTAFHGFVEDGEVRLALFDERRRIVYVSPAYAQWCGSSTDELIGSTCLFDSAAERGGLAPPPQVYDGQAVERTVYRQGDAAGPMSQVASFSPLTNMEGEVVGALGVLHDREPSGADLQPVAEDLHDRLRQAIIAEDSRRGLGEVTGDSPRMRQVQRQVQLASTSGENVLLVGPPGSGREEVARHIHSSAAHYDQPTLIPLACPLLDADLLNNTMTGLVRQCAELAAESAPSLLLLDVDGLSLDAQAVLMGMLEIQEFGICALSTSRQSLSKLAEAEVFREDLARELGTITVTLPALSERIGELPLLAQFFVEQFNGEGGRQFAGVLDEALGLLATHRWPSNLAEFKEVIRESCRSADPPWIGPDDLPKRVRHARDAVSHRSEPPESIKLDRFLADVERRLIERAIQLADGNRSQAARILGIHRTRLLRRIEHFQLGNRPRSPNQG